MNASDARQIAEKQKPENYEVSTILRDIRKAAEFGDFLLKDKWINEESTIQRLTILGYFLNRQDKIGNYYQIRWDNK